MSFSERQFRDVLGHFATGITVVTCLGGKGELIGITVNSFNSVSLEPPLVLFSVGRTALSFDEIKAADHLVINMLAADQAGLSNRFAEPKTDKWTGIDHERNQWGCPVIKGSLATLECTKSAHHDGGDHVIMVCKVDRLHANDDADPLIYYRGAYRSLAR